VQRRGSAEVEKVLMEYLTKNGKRMLLKNILTDWNYTRRNEVKAFRIPCSRKSWETISLQRF